MAQQTTATASAPAAVIIYTTWPDTLSAKSAGEALLTARAAACVNILGGMVSMYCWEGRIEQAGETVMLIKTQAAVTDQCIALIKQLHPYAIPCAVVLPVTGGLPAFLGWIAAETTPAT